MTPSRTRRKAPGTDTVRGPCTRTEGPPGSDTTPSNAPVSSPESTELELVAGTCRGGLLLVLNILNLVAALVCIGLIVAFPRAGSDPTPTPTKSATVHPSPSSPATKTPSGEPSTTTVPQPTPTMPSDPTDGSCNIFDPECSPGTSSGTTGGSEA